MLLADFGKPIGRNSSNKVKKDVYRLLAQIQIKSVEHIDSLLNVGCLDRRLEKLATQIDGLFTDENAISPIKTNRNATVTSSCSTSKKLMLSIS